MIPSPNFSGLNYNLIYDYANEGKAPYTEWKNRPTEVNHFSGHSVRTYNGVTYQCRQAHTAIPGWEPPNVPALWLRV